MSTRLLAVILLFAVPGATLAQATEWLEGVHYDRMDVPYDPPQDGRIEVAELFWYGCGSCFQFEPHIERWLERKPDDVVFTRHAASMAQQWRTHARGYYTAEALGIVDQVHGRVFNAIHMERNPMQDAEAFQRLFARHAGVDADTFRRTWDSFGVETRMRRGDQFARRYQLTGVPAVIVAGKYRTSPNRVGSYERMIELIDHLVALERGGPAPERAAGTERTPRPHAPAEPAPATQDPAEPATGERGPLLWVLWLIVLAAVVAAVVVAIARRRQP